MKVEALGLMREYVCKQRCLCQMFLEQFPMATNLLLEVPRHGNLSDEDEYWEFHRHGTGIRFVQPVTEVEIDVTDHLDCPDAIDTWRFVTYCESLSVEIVFFQDREFVTDDSGIRNLFEKLIAAGKLESASSVNRLFRLVTNEM